MFPLTRVPFGVHIFDPQPCVRTGGSILRGQDSFWAVVL